ncbi:hypothetical protein BCD67_00190 [Oscillatoriales cyanobacterium USR001]|nr:hypothetical protein BCD67_00190 [Oscillatoriales cyanobacterium USR001]
MYSKSLILMGQGKKRFEKYFGAIGTSIFYLRYRHLGGGSQVFMYSKQTQSVHGFDDFYGIFLSSLTCTQKHQGISQVNSVFNISVFC